MLKPVAVYANIDEFYEDRGGRFSAECDFGVHNRNDIDWDHDAPTDDDRGRVVFRPASPSLVRVTVVEDTGDVYTTPAGHSEAVARLGTMDLSGAADPYVECNRVFEGYSRGKSLGKNLSWYMERLGATVPEQTEFVIKARVGHSDGPPDHSVRLLATEKMLVVRAQGYGHMFDADADLTYRGRVGREYGAGNPATLEFGVPIGAESEGDDVRLRAESEWLVVTVAGDAHYYDNDLTYLGDEEWRGRYD